MGLPQNRTDAAAPSQIDLLNNKQAFGMVGAKKDYLLYPAAIPPHEKSDYIVDVLFDRFRYHSGEGDMWPLTWAEDDIIYAGAGDNKGCPMNLWRIQTLCFSPSALTNTGQWSMDMINPQPIPLSKYCQNPKAPYVKPSGLLDIKGVLYLSIEAQNYGNNPLFCRQTRIPRPATFSKAGCPPATFCSSERDIPVRGTTSYMPISPATWRMAAAIGRTMTLCFWGGSPPTG